MMEVAAMIDPLLTPPAAGRPNEVSPVQRRKRPEPARTAKIVTAGMSATALLSMVAAMGWQSGTGSANSGIATVPTQATGPAVAAVLPVAVAPSLAPAPIVEPPAATVPVAAVPVLTEPEAEVAPAPAVVVPRAVPVTTLPAKKTVKAKSHTTTKTSG
jgi:hypothetical protein